MALQVSIMPRVFKHGDIELADPGSHMNPDEVMSFYANTYPELTTSNVNGPEIKDGKAIYTFSSTVGVKG